MVLWLGTALSAVCALVQPNHPSADRERELHVLLDLHPGLHHALSARVAPARGGAPDGAPCKRPQDLYQSTVALTAKDSKSSSGSGSHDRKRVVKLHNAGEKNLERFLKHPPSDSCTLLPHPTTWVCHRLTRLSLRIEDKLPLVLASVAQACPQLQKLVVKTNILMLGQSHKVEDQTWLIEQSRHHPQALVEHRSWHTRQHRLSGMVAEVRYKYVELEDQIRCLSSLRGLERLVFRVSYLPGEVFTDALQWLKLGDSAAKRDGDWRRRLDNVWPNLELLSITYWHRTCDVGVLPAWEKGLQMMRPGAEVRIAYDPVDVD